MEKITKREIKDHKGFLASLSHQEFLTELGLEKVAAKGDQQNAAEIWELKKSPRTKGYHDTWCRSRIGKQLDELREKYGFDIFDIRRRVMSGETVTISIVEWQALDSIRKKYLPKHSAFILSGIDIHSCSKCVQLSRGDS